ncbi:hypothetical protein [Wenjunlia tyrosinilytica]|uniref:Uncharacterized protein n=1 Tax=Wenjunlia tyrosinilytica TaxID=1544741 RepID=A0A917ZJY4_9ACTN|nr:hypothetical protein [Wenjunlia tyrosinilytica]GGO84192.1 hypothetical protein GCM10012280_15100 [Wenjunlia tyrosinilytica]
MTAPKEHPRIVVLIDLRNGAEGFAALPFEELGRTAMREAGVSSADVSRVLVLDTPEGLLRHHAIHRAVYSHRSVSSLLCLVVGSALGLVHRTETGERYHDPHVFLRPVSLHSPNAVTLWVGDVRGVRWDPGQTGPAGLTDNGLRPDDTRGIEPLIETLRIPEVYDETVREVSSMPSAVASPALRLLVQEVPDDQLIRTQIDVMKWLSGQRDEHAADVVAGPVVLDPDNLPEHVTAASCVAEDGQLRAGYWKCVDLVHEAADRLEELAAFSTVLRGDASALVADIVDHRRQAALALGAHRELLAHVLDTVDGRVGLDAAQRDTLGDVGIRIPALPGTGSEEIGAALREQVLTATSRRRSLRALADGLRGFADRTQPTGSLSSRRRLDSVCPPRLVESLLGPAPFPRVTANASAVAAAAAAASALAQWAVPGVITGVVALLFVLAVGLRTLMGPAGERPGRERPGGLAGHPLADHPATRLSLLFGSVGAGSALGAVAADLGRAPTLLVPLALAVAVATVVGTVAVGWRRRVAAWRSVLALDAASTAAERLRELLDDCVVGHWLLADARVAASDRARALATALTEVADTLQAFSQRLELSSEAVTGVDDSHLELLSPVVHFVGQAGTPLRETLLDDLEDLAVEVLSPFWSVIFADPAAATRLPVAERTQALVDAYQAHLVHAGTAPPPPFAREPERRPDPATLVGADIRHVVDLLRDSQGPLQLCSVDQLRMLDRQPSAIRTFGFVPHAMQKSFLAADSPGADGPGPGERTRTLWTASGRCAGLLRLVPLALGAVRVGEPDGPAGNGRDPGSHERRPGSDQGGRRGTRTPEG